MYLSDKNKLTRTLNEKSIKDKKKTTFLQSERKEHSVLWNMLDITEDWIKVTEMCLAVKFET